MIIFDGKALAKKREILLSDRVKKLGKKITVAALVFSEDKASQLYTRLKAEAAARVGIEYKVQLFSVKEPLDGVLEQVAHWNTDPEITGIIIQKPLKNTWVEVTGSLPESYAEWWKQLVASISAAKDVDGLHPETLAAIQKGPWPQAGKVLPATARAVECILDEAQLLQKNSKIIIIGRTELLGIPLAAALQHRGFAIELIGRKELVARQQSGQELKDADIIVTATGVQGLIKGEMIKNGVALVDVGEPKADVDQESVSEVAGFLTPVPGGVGPMTISCLLENAIELVHQ